MRRWATSSEFVRRAAATLAAVVLALLTSHGSAAPSQPGSSQYLLGWFWKATTVLTPTAPGEVRSVALETTSPTSSAAFAAIGVAHQVDVYAYPAVPPAMNPAWSKEASITGTYASLSASRLAIGEPSYYDGYARVYERSARVSWIAMGPPLTPSIASRLAMEFGRPVEIDGDTLVVGSPSFDFEGRAF